ncbi:MAG: UvrD-helicase domain-containing protein, partial [Oscillospiraceae bacterium]|nr:UvrD-helicase domain-containing protein [Oscillospiraceae bacterium]
RNATKSLHEKLNRELNKRLSEETDPELCEHLKEQIFGLRQAYISTIDAFCLKIIKENPEAFDLPMNFTLADAPKQTSMQLRAIDLAMQDFYNENLPDDNCSFTKKERETLFFTFDFERDTGLRDAVMSAADNLSSCADAEKWLSDAENAYKDITALEKRYLSAFAPQIKTDFSRAAQVTEQYKGLAAFLIHEADEIESRGDKTAKSAAFKTYCEKIIPQIENYIDFDLRRCKEFCENYRSYEAAPSMETLCKMISDFRAHGEPPKVDGKSGTKTETRSVFNSVKKLSEKISILENDFDYESTLASLPDQQTAIRAFIKLVNLYRGYYNFIKRTSGCLDFSDCELLLLKKLENEEFRAQISSRFSCIIVDEFQDSNDIQAEIFKRLGNDHLFYVGDVKQSIYAFRGGNPEIMAGLCDGKDGFTALPLNRNYRSRKPVIDVTNAAFSGLMTREYGGVDYEDTNNRLVFGADFLPEIPEEFREKYSSEICFIGGAESDDKDMTAPRIAAERIRALHDDPNFKITKNGQLVRPDYSDFAILLRKKPRIANYRAALAELGISSAAPKGQHFLESEEITLILNYITIVDNPLRDEEMLKVLMSPIYRFTAEEISLLRLGLLGLDKDVLNTSQKRALARVMKSYSLFNCVRICSKPLEYADFPDVFDGQPEGKTVPRTANAKLAAFFRDITAFRYYMGSSSVYRLVFRICED